MATNDLRVGIIGCGGIAARHLATWKEHGVPVTALMDVQPENCRKMDAPDAAVFTDAAALLDSGVNVVSICTPPVAHAEMAAAALARGVHVLLEKPLADTVANAHRIAAAVAQSAALLMPAFRHRFLPAVRRMKELLAAGRIGRPVFFHNTFCGPAFQMKDRWFTRKAIAGGGCLLDTNSHSVDLFRFLIGEVEEQHAVMSRHFVGTDVEDAGILSVKAADGTVGCFTSAFVAGTGMADIDIMGEEGRLRYDYMDPEKITLWRRGVHEPEIIATTPSGGWSEQVAHFLAAVRGEGELTCTITDGVRCMEIIGATYGE